MKSYLNAGGRHGNRSAAGDGRTVLDLEPVSRIVRDPEFDTVVVGLCCRTEEGCPDGEQSWQKPSRAPRQMAELSSGSPHSFMSHRPNAAFFAGFPVWRLNRHRHFCSDRRYGAPA